MSVLFGNEVGPFEAIAQTDAGRVVEQTWYRMPDRLVTHEKKTTLLPDPSGGGLKQSKIEEKWFTFQGSIYNQATGAPLNQPKLLSELAKTWGWVKGSDGSQSWRETTEEETVYDYDANQFLTLQVSTKKAWNAQTGALEPKERTIKKQKALSRDFVEVATEPYAWNATDKRWIAKTPDASIAAGQLPGGIYSGGGFGGNTPTITWPDPAPIELGTALSAIQLNAKADVPGRFDYTPGAGTVLPLGSHQLSAKFTPSDLINYRTTTATTTLAVTKRKVIITWAPPAPITSNTELGPDQLNATASAPGKLVYSPAAGRKLSGQGPPAWSATSSYGPGDRVVHGGLTYEAIDSNDNSEPPSSHWNAVESQPDFVWRGEWAMGASYALNDIVERQGSADVALAANQDVEPPADGVWGSPSEAGYQTLAVHFTPTDKTTYDQARYEVPIKVVGVPAPKTPFILWNPPAQMKFGVDLSGEQLNAVALEDAVLGPPAGLSASLLPPGSGGTWGAPGSVSAVVTASNEAGETVASGSASVYIGDITEAVLWEWDAVNGATSYAVYRTSSPGGLLASGLTDTSYIDTGAATSGGTPASVGAGMKIVPGWFDYTPPAGTALARGQHKLKAKFTPADPDAWNTADKTVSIQVGATGRVPKIYWSPAPLAHEGDPLTSAQLDAVASIDQLAPDATPLAPPGGLEGFVTSPTGGSWPSLGSVSAQVTAYNSAGESLASAESTVVIADTANTVTWGWNAVSGAAGYRLYRDGGLLADVAGVLVDDAGAAPGGGAPPDTAPTATVTPLAGTYVYLPPDGTVLAPGSHQLSVLFTPDDLGNYDRVTGHASITAPGADTKRRPYIYWPTPPKLDEKTGLSGAQLNAVALEKAPAGGPGGLLGFVSAPGAGGVWPSAVVVRAVVTAVTDSGESPPSGEATAVLTNRTEVITWAWESAGSATSYRIYRDGGIIGSTSSTSFADDGSASPGGGPGTPAGMVQVPGTMLYSPVAGTVLKAGSQQLSVFFTPTDRDTWNTALGHNSVEVTGEDKGKGGTKNGHVTYEGVVDSDPAAEPLEFSDSNLDLATLALIYSQVAQCSGLWQQERLWKGLTGYPWIHKLDPCAFTGPVLEDGTRMDLKAGTVLEHTLSHDESRVQASQTKKLRVVRWTPEGELER
jgi:hypothetical protein